MFEKGVKKRGLMNKIRIGIIGGTGYTGVELLRLLANHPHAHSRIQLERIWQNVTWFFAQRQME